MDDFDALYATQYARVLAGCVALAGTLDVARDATDEAFARAYERWATVGIMSAPGAWVQVVALNHLRRGLRRTRFERLFSRTRLAVTVEELPDLEVWEAVRQLPPRQQVTVTLRYFHDLPEAAVAEAMGVSRGSVSASLAAARARLRLLIDRELEEETLHG